MFARTREQPSVVSSRVLKTHRLNEVETFRLQGKINTIDNEIHTNYCQISDEIDGVRKNLNRIKKLKNNLGISVARRKLLREKGVFVLPSPGFKDEGITLRRRDGKKVLVRGKECYDGEIIRKYLDMSLEFSELNIEGNVEAEDSGSESCKGDEEIHEKKRLFHYRIITPPLRPGSRRNFKDFDEEYDSDIDMDLPPSENYMDSLRKSPYLVRAQTAVGSRKNSKTTEKITRPKTSQTRQSFNDLDNNSFHEDNQEIIKTLESNSENLRDDTRILSEENGQLQAESTAKTKYNTDTKGRKINFDNSKTDSNHESEPKHGKETLRRNSGDNFNSGEIIPTISVVEDNKAIEKDSTKKLRKTSAISFSSQMTPVRHQRKQSLPAEPLKLLQRRRSIEDTRLPLAHDGTSFQEPLDNGNRDVNTNLEVSPRSVESANNRHPSPSKEHSTRKISRTQNPPEYQKHKNTGQNLRSRTESFNSIANSSAAIANRRPGSGRKLSTVNNDFIYDARPDKALSKGYTTMQMTIGGKQVRLCVPKFSNDDIVERVRAKTAAKLADDRTRGHAPKQPEVSTTSEKKANKMPFM